MSLTSDSERGGILSKGMTVKCSRCMTGYNIYDDIQVKSDVRFSGLFINSEHKNILNKAVGICPVCNNVEGFRFEHPFTFEYNAGNVDPHLKGEDNYDWDWLEYEKSKGKNLTRSEAGLEDSPSGDFDQDQDLINANMGWE